MSMKFAPAVVSACVIAALSAPVAAYAQAATYNFNIPAQDLGGALRAYERTTGQQVVVDGSLVWGKVGTSVVGQFTASEALDRLLAGSGLVAQRRYGVIYVEAAGGASDR